MGMGRLLLLVTYKICLKSAGLYDFFVFFDWFLCCFVWRLFIIWRNASTFHGLIERKEIGQHFPMNCSKIGHSYGAFTSVFGRNIFIRLLYANRKSSADLLKHGVTGDLKITETLLARSIENLNVSDFPLWELGRGPVKVNRRSPRISAIPRLFVTTDFKRSAI